MVFEAFKQSVARSLIETYRKKRLGRFTGLKKLVTKVKVMHEADLTYALYDGDRLPLQNYAKTLENDEDVKRRAHSLEIGIIIDGIETLRAIQHQEFPQKIAPKFN